MSIQSTTTCRWRQTNRLQLELLEMDRNYAPHQPLTEIVLDGRIQDLFTDWNDFTDKCLGTLISKPIVWTGPHVFLTTAMGISDLVDSWHDAILHIYLTKSPSPGQEQNDDDDDDDDDDDEVSVYSVYTTVEERPTRTIDGICKLLSHCQPALRTVEFSMLLYPLSTLSLSRLTAGNIQKLEVTAPKGEWSGRECQALASANPDCQLEIMVDTLTDDAEVLGNVLMENGGPSRLRLGATIGWESFLRLTQPLLVNTRLKSLTILEVTSAHLALLAVSLAENRGLEELAIVGTFGSKSTDTSFQGLMEAVAMHKKLTSLTLNLQLPPDASHERVAQLSQSIQNMVIQNKSLIHVSLPLDYAFLECITIDVDRYLNYNKHRPRATAVQASEVHRALLAPTLASVSDHSELIYLFLRQALEYL